MFFLPTLSALCIAVHLAAATTYSVCDGQCGGPRRRTYFYGGNETITELSTLAVPANPTAYNHWIPGINLAQFGIANPTPSTDIAVVGYLSPATKAFAVRMFYQTTDGAIRTAFHSGVPWDVNWKLDPIVIAIGRLGTPLSAFQSNLNGVPPVGRR
ncbi:hypothetical protein B0H14DRAFT_3140852 [Mycena olivaceomarginata]|nr:hypothetical protein B0H14DRAFT_3140852 [Mycena olivaceomarginata]